MKHIFIVNPAAGKEEFRNDLSRRLHSVSADFQVYLTKAPKDATRFVRKYCSENSEPVRFYACGGDGTLSEVAAGIVGFENAELSCCPCGSGNDFVKYYGGEEAFRDIEALINAPSHPIDLIKINDTYSLNVVNFGFDTHVAKTMEKVREAPLRSSAHSATLSPMLSPCCSTWLHEYTFCKYLYEEFPLSFIESRNA